MTIATEGASSHGGQQASGRFAPPDLDAFTTAALVALGAPAGPAGQVAASLVASNLVGHDSHGIIRLIQYSAWMVNGQIQLAAQPEISQRQGAIAVIDGHWGFGQPAARLAVDGVAQAAAAYGVAAVTIRQCNHIGRLGEYVSDLAERGLAGLAFCNAGPVVAPLRGAGRALGTNPFAWAAPGGPDGPLVVDFSTAGVAEGKLKLAAADGHPVAEGLIVDATGHPSTNADDFSAGGALLPFGGHKGSGLSVMIELLGGLLTGMGTAPTPDYQGGNGTVMIALRVAAFAAPASSAASAVQSREQLVTAGRGAAPGPVLLPGEIEARTRADRLRDGIPVSPAGLAAIYAVTVRVGVPRPLVRPIARPAR